MKLLKSQSFISSKHHQCLTGAVLLVQSKTYDQQTEKFMDFSFEKTNSAYMLFYERIPAREGGGAAGGGGTSAGGGVSSAMSEASGSGLGGGGRATETVSRPPSTSNSMAGSPESRAEDEMECDATPAADQHKVTLSKDLAEVRARLQTRLDKYSAKTFERKCISSLCMRCI
jgi:hypothetical protein